ncbi:MAG TPA: CHASE3 domain-containing protein, partial [Candidatus Baltobacteraceae bacterium]|nr:CHASE3 domain-containing protein [Candidatus Baltobacteraceae bacterium]
MIRASSLPFLLAGAVFATLVAMLLWMRGTVDRDTLLQQRVRIAQYYRSHALKAQLDEETGMRGYALTRNRVFLQPYVAARERFPALNASLQIALEDLHLPAQGAREQARLNAEWLRTVAEPAIRDPALVTVQLRGKALVDRFRRLDENIYADLNLAADRSDRSSLELANRAVFFALPIAVCIACIVAFVYRRNRRYEMDRRVTDGLQRALAPARLPDVDGADLGAVYVPAGIQARVGGDWYDAVEFPDGRMLFSLGDVAGHGVSAAVTMNRVRQT